MWFWSGVFYNSIWVVELSDMKCCVDCIRHTAHELMSSREEGSKILKRVFYMCSLSCQRAFGLS